MPITKEDIDGIDPLEYALEKEGITTERLALKLNEELEAKETKFFQKDGRIISKRNVIAWNVRQKAREDAHKLLGHYPAESHRIEGFISHTHAFIGHFPPEPETIGDWEQQIREVRRLKEGAKSLTDGNKQEIETWEVNALNTGSVPRNLALVPV